MKKLDAPCSILAARFYLRTDGRKPDRLDDGILREALGEVIRK
jgi:hypothetical protein